MKKYEESLYCQGYKNIAGLDEVGRGCWAGPLVVAICVLPTSYCNSKIKDSFPIMSTKKYIPKYNKKFAVEPKSNISNFIKGGFGLKKDLVKTDKTMVTNTFFIKFSPLV